MWNLIKTVRLRIRDERQGWVGTPDYGLRTCPRILASLWPIRCKFSAVSPGADLPA
jgi:hypothetical protein